MSKVIINTTEDSTPVDETRENVDIKKDDAPELQSTATDEEESKPKVETTDDDKVEDGKEQEGKEGSKEEGDEPEVEQIEVDGVIYNVDENGNAIDPKTSDVKYTKDDLDKLSEAESEEQPTSTWKNIIEKTNIVPVDNDGNPIEYDDSEEGQTQYIKDVYSIAAEQSLQQYQDNLFNTYPILVDVLNHLSQNNGDLTEFQPSTRYTNIELDKDNEIQLKDIIYKGRQQRGESQERIDKYYNYLKDSNSIYEEAEVELEYLRSQEQNRTKEVETKRKQEQEQREKELNEYWGVQYDEKVRKLVDLNKEDSIYGAIKTGKLKIGNEEYTIPDKIRINDNGKITYATRDDFFNYLYQPIDYNIDNKRVTMTKHEYDVMVENQKRNTQHDIFDAYKRFVKYDTSQFIKEQVSNQQVRNIKRKLSTKRNKHSDVSSDSSSKKIIIPKTN